MNAVSTAGLTKYYGARAALRDLTLEVPTGRLFGFLGPNGAGKTTAIRILIGLLRASRGSARVFGRDVWRAGPAARQPIGYLPGDVRFYDWMTGGQTLDFLDRARRSRAAPEIRRLSAAFDLELGKLVRDYSRGMKQKLGLIAALMHRPRLLILDEPTTSLDPLVREALFAELHSAAAEGRTVLFSSHTLAEVEALCDEVAILRGGRLVEHERVDVLRRRALRHVEIVFRPGAAPRELPEGLEDLRQQDGYWRGLWQGPMDRLLGWLAQSSVVDVTIAPPDLEDLFRSYYLDAQPEHGP